MSLSCLLFITFDYFLPVKQSSNLNQAYYPYSFGPDFNPIAFVFFLLYASAMVLFSILAIRLYGISFSRFFFSLLGMALLLVYIIFYSYALFSANKITAAKQKSLTAAKELLHQTFSGQQYSGAEKSRVSKFYATMYFLHNGQIIEWQDQSGKKIKYNPPPEELRSRKEYLNNKLQFEQSIKKLKIYLVLLIISLAVSILLAFIIPVKKNMKKNYA